MIIIQLRVQKSWQCVSENSLPEGCAAARLEECPVGGGLVDEEDGEGLGLAGAAGAGDLAPAIFADFVLDGAVFLELLEEIDLAALALRGEQIPAGAVDVIERDAVLGADAMDFRVDLLVCKLG